MTQTNGSKWLSSLFPWSWSARWSSFNILSDAWYSTSQRCLGSLFRGVFPTPPSPQPDLDEWLGWSVRQTFPPTTRPRLFLAFVLHVLASSFCCTGGQGFLCTHPQRGVSRARDKGQSLVFTILSILSVCCSQWSAFALQQSAGLYTFGVRGTDSRADVRCGG